MAYEKPIKIKEAISAIEDGEYVLPSIQREFVWSTDQIATLFDSLMRDYPISTFLFWKVRAYDVSKFQFYSFLRDYHERDRRHNQEATLSGNKDVIAILDGQQRLTSLYISLRGTHASKLSNYRKTSDHAYPKKRLFLNLLKKSGKIEKEYDFQFLTNDDAKRKDAEHLWFPVGEILAFDDVSDALEWISEQLDDLCDRLDEPVSKEAKKFARVTLNKLFKVICEDDTLNFFLEKGEELDKVLQIFIRINQGGTPLSYSDLLLSIATAQWKKLDARKEIHEFVDRINDIGKGFSFSKDFVLKSCLVLADIKDVRFKVDNFSSENMSVIEDQWPQISGAIELAVRLAAHFGFDGKTLTATNAIIPIAYFIKVKGKSSSILHSTSEAPNRIAIKQWLIRALLKRAFGGQPDALYPAYRKLIKEGNCKFPLEVIIARFSGRSRNLDFYETDIDALLDVDYGSAYAFMLLSLYSPINHDYDFHQDHVHPRKHFTLSQLRMRGITDQEEQNRYQERFNKLANLQLLQETQNMEKQAKLLSEWAKECFQDPDALKQYRELHLFPPGESLEFGNFVNFYDARRIMIRSRLMELLDVKTINRNAELHDSVAEE